MPTYPDDGITYQDSDIILACHSDTSYPNKYKAHIISGAHIFLYEEDPILKLNGPILKIAQIIKFFVSSAAEAKLAGLCIVAKEIFPLHHTII